LPPHHNFPSWFLTTTSLPLLFSTVSISYCVKIFHRTLLPRHVLLWLIQLEERTVEIPTS
jgi:hypothetical protein